MKNFNFQATDGYTFTLPGDFGSVVNLITDWHVIVPALSGGGPPPDLWYVLNLSLHQITVSSLGNYCLVYNINK